MTLDARAVTSLHPLTGLPRLKRASIFGLPRSAWAAAQDQFQSGSRWDSPQVSFY